MPLQEFLKSVFYNDFLYLLFIGTLCTVSVTCCRLFSVSASVHPPGKTSTCLRPVHLSPEHFDRPAVVGVLLDPVNEEYVSFWIDLESVPARISLGILTMLTITTQSSVHLRNMPAVSFTKAIDVWMATCLVFVFGSFIEYSVVNVLARREKMNQQQQEQQQQLKSQNHHQRPPNIIETTKQVRHRLIACPHCRRKVRQPHFCATVSLFCDSVDRALRCTEHYFASVLNMLYLAWMTTKGEIAF